MGILKNMFKRKDPLDEFEEELKGSINTQDQEGSYPGKNNKFPKYDEEEFSHSFGKVSSRIGGDPENIPPSSYPSGSGYGGNLRESPLQSSPPLTSEIELMKRNIELISAKLDAIKSAMETMNMKIETIERIALQESGGGRSGSQRR